MRYLVWVIAFFMSITTIAQTATEQLKQCIEASQSFKWNEGSKEVHPLGVFSKERFEKESAFAKAQLKKLNTISPKTLSETERISLELLKFKLQETVDYYEYERFLNPLLSDSGFHSSWNYMVRPITSYRQAVKYLDKLNALPEVVNQYVPLLREGLKKGVSQPRVIFEGYESTYNSQIVADYKDSFYYTPFLNLRI